MKDKAISILSLFASTSTLLCCALPTLLVTLGMGAVVAGAVSAVPWLIPLSMNKEWVFLFAGLLIVLNWVLIIRRARSAAANACEIPESGASDDTACDTASRFSRVVLWVSTALYIVGFLVAFLAFPVGDALGLF
ncbi:hypothetical protein JYT28_00230 [Desulfobulbus sp. AH-315-M07]|nr:hypothetical protein [Desulfobulbus sp. AH-315-M07]